MSEEAEENLQALRKRDRIIINCGGVRHETYRSTLRNFPSTRLAWCTENVQNIANDYDPEKNEVFFDRHPAVFGAIINYYRTGKLHSPHDVCGPLFEEELAFWGIDEKQMEPCCWTYYTQHREAQENLKFFEAAEMTGEDDCDQDSELGDVMSDSQIENLGGEQSCWQKYKPRIWNVLEHQRSSKLARMTFFVSLMFIILSVLAYCVQTISHVDNDPSASLAMVIIEGVCGIWFTVEFTLRLATCPSKQDFVKQMMNWIDFIAIWPFYVRIFTTENYPHGPPSLAYDILAICRLLRLFRFFKVNLGFQILKQTMIASLRELLLLVLLLIVPVIIFASCAYLAEKNDNPKEFGSIPESFWWAIITITTVGYGDTAPVTPFGKVFGSLCAALSIIITALPISIIGNNFSLYYSHAQAQMKLPKKSKRPMVGAANALMLQSARPSDDMTSTDMAEERRESGKAYPVSNGSLGGDAKVHPYRGRARRARSSLYAGGMTHRQSYPIRTRSSEEIITVNSPPLDDRKKSHTSTQSTTIDTPPKSPPHYGNTLTVDPPELSEAITGFIDRPEINQSLSIIHRESDEFEMDEIDHVIASIKKDEKENKDNMLNGNPGKPGTPGRPSTPGRPGTPVKRTPKNSVRFVKPTLTVTLNSENKDFVNEKFDEDEQEETNEQERHTKNGDNTGRFKFSRRRGAQSPAYSNSSVTDLQPNQT